jgi:TetR/AcrR family transcriptional repressor of bet genes
MKIVDHPQRRRELARAAWEVIGRRGLDGASIRQIADAAGWSHATLRHYFRNRDELLGFAFALIGERTKGIIATVADDPPRKAIREALMAALPLSDEDGRLVSVIWFVFSAQAIVNPKLQDEWNRVRDVMLTGLTDLIARAQELGEVDRDLDPRQEAVVLVTTLDGIGLHALAEPAESDDVTIELLDVALERLFGRR